MRSLITAVALFVAAWLPGTTLAHHGWSWTDDGNVDLTGMIRSERLYLGDREYLLYPDRD